MDINEFNKLMNFSRIKLIASTGPSNYIRSVLNSLSDEEFEEYLNYHLSICEREDLLGASSHLLDIVKVNK